MSTFFRALERAKQQRLLQEQSSHRVSDSAETSAQAPVASGEERPAKVELPEIDQLSAPPLVGPQTQERSRPEAAWVKQKAPFPKVEERPAKVELPEIDQFSAPPLVGPQTQERSRPEAARVKQKAPFPKVEEHLVSLLNPTSFEAEQYRTLHYVVEQNSREKNLRVIAVTSPAVGDGKTLTAINLAGALAQSSDLRVLIVDADLRRPSVGNCLGIAASGSPSLVDAILNPGRSLEEVVRRHLPYNLSVLPLGESAAAPHELLRSPRLGELLGQARAKYDYVVLDMPPLVAVPDCRVMAQWVDGFLLVVAAHKTPRKLVEEALNVLEPEKTIGIVFNNDDRPLAGYYGYYYSSQPGNGNRDRWWNRARKRLNHGIRPSDFSRSRS